MTRGDALKAYEVVQADWIKAIKAVPALQERIKQNASFANVMTEAARMADTGYSDGTTLRELVSLLLQKGG